MKNVFTSGIDTTDSSNADSNSDNNNAAMPWMDTNSDKQRKLKDYIEKWLKENGFNYHGLVMDKPRIKEGCISQCVSFFMFSVVDFINIILLCSSICISTKFRIQI